MLAGFDDQFYGCAYLTIDLDIHKFRDGNDDDPIFSQVSLCKDKGFDSLVNSASANCLNIGVFAFTHNASNSACYSSGPRIRFYLDDVHVDLPRLYNELYACEQVDAGSKSPLFVQIVQYSRMIYKRFCPKIAVRENRRESLYLFRFQSAYELFQLPGNKN